MQKVSEFESSFFLLSRRLFYLDAMTPFLVSWSSPVAGHGLERPWHGVSCGLVTLRDG